MSVLVTGAAGFIGSNFVRYVLGLREGAKIVAFDKLTYAGNLANIADLLDDPRLTLARGDICDSAAVAHVCDQHQVHQIVNFAAESHVDRSIIGAGAFVQTNIAGTQVLLDVARAKGIERFLQVSTDEVYGSLPEDRPDVKFTESTPLEPNSPYSASKAGADCLVHAYFHTFGTPTLITRCSNNYGPYQFPEKLIPLFITNLMESRKVPLYGDGLNIRDWIYVEDHCEAIWLALTSGRLGEVYNIGAETELTNRQITETILSIMGRSWDEWVQPVKDRPGHDRRYAIDSAKARRELHWAPRHRFHEAIRDTVQWYREHESWWRAIKTGEYLRYYETQYVNR